MAGVKITFLDERDKLISEHFITTTGDTTYVFDDISNWIHKDEEFGNVPQGTKRINISIDCDM